MILPTLNVVPIVQSDTTTYEPPLAGLVLSAVGTIEFVNDRGDTVTFIVPAAVATETVTALPFTLWGRVRKVNATNTTIADANIHGIRTN